MDTNVISAAAPSKAAAPADLLTWMDEASALLHLSAVTIAEIEDGAATASREGATRKADALARWIELVLHLYRGRVLAFDVDAARIAGAMSDHARGQVHSPGFADIAIAATAKANGLTILTRNVRHFEMLGVPVVDPFKGIPTVR